MIDRAFYVYVIFRLDGSPCYVGKGRGNRYLDHAKGSHNHALSEIYKQSGGSLPVVKVLDGVSEDDAFDAEEMFISAVGRAVDGGPLVNILARRSGWSPKSPDITKAVYNDIIRSLAGADLGWSASRSSLIKLYKDGTLRKSHRESCRRFGEDWRTSADITSPLKRIDASNRIELAQIKVGLKSLVLVVMSVVYDMTWPRIGDAMGFSDITAKEQTIRAIHRLTSFYNDIFVTL